MQVSSLDHLHRERRETLKLAGDSVLHSVRHTYGTRLGESKADAFARRPLRGHSSITVSQRYVHPIPEALQRAVDGLEAMATVGLSGGQERVLPGSVSATSAASASVSL